MARGMEWKRETFYRTSAHYKRKGVKSRTEIVHRPIQQTGQ